MMLQVLELLTYNGNSHWNDNKIWKILYFPTMLLCSYYELLCPCRFEDITGEATVLFRLES